MSKFKEKESLETEYLVIDASVNSKTSKQAPSPWLDNLEWSRDP